MTPVPRAGYRIGVPRWRLVAEVLNTDSAFYGGSDLGNNGGVHTDHTPSHGEAQSLELLLPPLATILSAWGRLTMLQSPTALLPGKPYPLGAHVGWSRDQFRGVLRARATDRSVPVRSSGRRELTRLTLPEYTDEVWHGYLPHADIGHGLRLSRPWSLRPAAGASLQSQQTVARSLCLPARR